MGARPSQTVREGMPSYLDTSSQRQVAKRMAQHERTRRSSAGQPVWSSFGWLTLGEVPGETAPQDWVDAFEVTLMSIRP